MLVDEFTSLLPGGGNFYLMTLRTWCPATCCWQMTFLASHQPVAWSRFVGERRGDEMHLTAEGRDFDGTEGLARIRFWAITPERLQWEQQMSTDGGASWRRAMAVRAWRPSRD